MLSRKSTVFYTYLYLRYDGTPYYVGKGKGDRALVKQHGCKPPVDTSRTLIQEHVSEADAFAAEVFLIAYYGRKNLGTGILLNRTDGGEGPSGQRMSDATKKKMSLSKKGKQPCLGYRHSAETRAKMSAAKIGNNYSSGRVWSSESRARASMSHTGLPWSEARRQAEEKRKVAA